MRTKQCSKKIKDREGRKACDRDDNARYYEVKAFATGTYAPSTPASGSKRLLAVRLLLLGVLVPPNPTDPTNYAPREPVALGAISNSLFAHPTNFHCQPDR